MLSPAFLKATWLSVIQNKINLSVKKSCLILSQSSSQGSLLLQPDVRCLSCTWASGGHINKNTNSHLFDYN